MASLTREPRAAETAFGVQTRPVRISRMPLQTCMAAMQA